MQPFDDSPRPSVPPGRTDRSSTRERAGGAAAPRQAPSSTVDGILQPNRTGPLSSERFSRFPEDEPRETPASGRAAPGSAPKLLAAPPPGYWPRTGLGLKLRFFVALCILALIPATLLVLVAQASSQALATSASQQTLGVAARTEAAALSRQLTSIQDTTQQVAQDPSLATFAQAILPTASRQAAEALLRGASLANAGSLMWAVVSGSDQVLASWPAAPAGQLLSHLSLLRDPSRLETYVRNQRQAALAAGPFPQVGVAADPAIAGTFYLASLSFLTPKDQGHSALVLAVSSLQQTMQPLVAPLASSYTLVLDHQGTLLAAEGNQPLTKHIGQPLAIASLRQAATTQPPGDLISFADPDTGTLQLAVGVSCGPQAAWTCLVVSPAAVVSPELNGLLDPRNTPLVLLSLFVVVLLVGSWVAYPIVQPIRKATRQIINTTAGIRLLSNNIEGLGQDHAMMGQVVDNLVRGVLARGATSTKQASMVRECLVTAAHSLVQLAHQVTATETLSPQEAHWFREQIVAVYQALQRADHLSATTIAGWQQIAPEAQWFQIRAGVQDMTQTYLESQEGVQQRLLEMEALGQIAQDLAQGRGSRERPQQGS